ncbi:MAG: DNA alkylation repair protein [bacterium]|nr:DNA alkylation repair protein [bacterium]
MEIDKIKKELQKYASPQRAEISRRFFKTGPGEYGEGDVFIGVTVPAVRKIAKQFSPARTKIFFPEDGQTLGRLLKSKIHEERLCALLILVNQFQNGNETEKKEIYSFYLKHAKHVNNWDLVDLSADKIIGAYLSDKDKKILHRLARSKNLWERRIAIVATYHFIKNNQFNDTLKISEILLEDKHDLIHKAVGWMLREVGKKYRGVEEKFLLKYYQTMPRTMLRYAIEKFPEKLRQQYLKKIKNI